MKQSILHLFLRSLFISVISFPQLAFSQIEKQQDPFGDYVTRNNDTVTVPQEALTKYPKFDAFLNEHLNFSVPIIGVEKLKEYKKDKLPIVILDTRSEIAYKTSHIPGAKRVGYDDFSVERVWSIPRDAHIVVYCTTGIQSEQIGEYLEMMGFTNVENLYGSIIEWVNEDGVVVNRDGEKTQKVVIKDKDKKQFMKKGRAVIMTESEVLP